MSVVLSLMLALLLDVLFKEPKRYHPLVGFGRWAYWVEVRLHGPDEKRWRGGIAWCCAVLPIVFIFLLFGTVVEANEIAKAVLGGIVLYVAIGWQSLIEHAVAIISPLKEGNIAAARAAVGRIVSRDTSELDEPAVALAATESVLENGADAVFAAIFWFVVAGVPGVVLYRLSNTLDAMWGYKNDRYYYFGWAAARMDDLLNYIPARLTALSYVIMGSHLSAWAAWRNQAATWNSPNAGPVMASGAGAIDTRLGGSAVYHGESHERPILGPEDGESPSAASIEKAVTLVNRSLLLWFIAVCFIGLMWL